ncbi:uncharacterized protein LOC115034037 [Acyrthosiphon pisum]|uniref:Glyceraldehyde 3-phosphate dehydrogenase NAD(P) binding domain-containing protein n=1 Tax=Acyrthosiphon pisum TaxID=7029 RepID=A0A8R2NTE2_ACYPI|nr:uncharacterized protein LOC115034037 [Acyrthosiphon pisum]
MFKNAMRLISTGLRCMQGPSRVCSSSLINGDTFSRIMGESVRQFSIQNSVNAQYKPQVSCTSLPPIAINGFGRIGKCVLLKALQENMNGSRITHRLFFVNCFKPSSLVIHRWSQSTSRAHK